MACSVCHRRTARQEASFILYAGLDLSRKRLDVCLLDEQGTRVAVTTAPPDADGLRGLADRLVAYDEPIYAALESMNGARFALRHPRAAGLGGRRRRLRPRSRAWRRSPPRPTVSMPTCSPSSRAATWCQPSGCPRPVCAMRASGRAFASTSYVTAPQSKARIHAGLIAYGHPCPVSDLFGARGRALLGSCALPEAWRTSITASLRLIEHLDGEIDACEAELRRLGVAHPYVPLLMTAPGIASRTGLHHRRGDR